MIENFYFFGTSYSAGGGLKNYKTENLHAQNYLKKLITISEYKNLPKNYSVSYEFKKLLNKNNIKYKNIKNLSKGGYGLERIFREVHKLIFDSNFNKNKSILIIELSDNIYRRDFYYNPIKDYVVGTHRKGLDSFYIMNKFWEDSKSTINSFLKNKEKIIDFFKLTYDVNETLKKSEIDTLMLISLLENLKINYVFSSGPYYVNQNKLNKINFNYDKIIIDDLESWIVEKKLDIHSESKSKVPDTRHLGIQGTKILSKLIFDKIFKNKVFI